MRTSLKIAIPAAAVLLAGTAAAFAQNDSFSDGEPLPPAGPPVSIYDKIYARYGHLGRDVREEFRDGPCRIERHWERDGDFKEVIKCRGPRD
jgi:hypothetical protein